MKDSNSKPILFRGETHGKIVSARGSGTFGWDPVFEVDGMGKTYAELDSETKNKLSHRYKSLVKLTTYLDENLDLLKDDSKE